MLFGVPRVRPLKGSAFRKAGASGNSDRRGRMGSLLKQDPAVLPGGRQQATVHTHRFSCTSIEFPLSPTLPSSASPDSTVVPGEVQV